MTTKNDTDVCAICGTLRKEHGERNHHFSEDGELKAKTPPAARAPRGTIDLPLRLLLMQKELVTQEELDQMDAMVGRVIDDNRADSPGRSAAEPHH